MGDATRSDWIDGETRLMGLIGENIAYTRSPRLHNRAARVLGINAVYLPLSMPAAAVGAFLKSAWFLGSPGFNVTTPHKERVARLLPGPGCRSVNTVYRGRDGWRTASTDAEGFVKGLDRIDCRLKDFGTICVLGNGGAALALVEHLASVKGLGKVTVRILRRRAGRDRTFARAAGRLAGRLDFSGFGVNELAEAVGRSGPETLLVQATKAPQQGDDLKWLVPGLDGFRGTVVDMVYGKPSALYFTALARDLRAQDGEAMLIEQARLSQRLWWGKAAAYEDMAAALRGKQT